VILFRLSRLYEQEIQRWILCSALLIWALTASVLALQNRKEILVVGISSSGSARIIESKDDRYIQEELKGFLLSFLEQYFNFDQANFLERVGRASDLMTIELWNQQKAKLAEIQEGLKKEPLKQSATIESLDLISDSKVEAILDLHIEQRLAKRNIKIRVTIEVAPHERSAQNPWGYEIKELSDVVL